MSELRDRLEALAARGTHRGADEVLRAAQRDAQTIPVDDTASDFDDSDMEILDDDSLPVVTLEPRSRRRRYGSLIATVGIAALVGIGGLAITAMIGSGGAGSPEGAVRQLADAVSHKDPLAAVDVLVPSEVRSMRDTVKAASDRAAELKIVNEASQPLAGIDLSVDHLVLRTEPLADGYAKVVITSGDISAKTHRAQMSALIQKAWRDGTDGDSQVDLATLSGDSGVPTFVVVIRQHGGWYVSPAYTAMEYIREVNHYPAADFGSAKAAELGAATPDAAVSDALHAWQQSDWDRLIALAPPDELPLYDYRAMLDASAADADVNFTIDHLSTTSTESGDTAVVKLGASGTTGTGRDGDHGTWQVGGTCPSFLDQARGESSNLCLSGDLSGTLPFGLMVAGGSTTGEQTTGPISISVVREDGRWFVSPVTTVLDVVDNTIRHIDQRMIYTLFGLAYELPPDATITLDQPFQVAASRAWLKSSVYAFEGHAGQKIVGEIAGGVGKDSYSYAYGTVYTTDGEELGSIDFQTIPTGPDAQYLYANSVELPSDGSYRLVINPYPTTDGALTLWDLDHAPAALRRAAEGNTSTGSCSSSGGGLLGSSDPCVIETLPVTPTTAFTGSGTTGSSQGVTATTAASSDTTAPTAPTASAAASTTVPAPSTTSAP